MQRYIFLLIAGIVLLGVTIEAFTVHQRDLESPFIGTNNVESLPNLYAETDNSKPFMMTKEFPAYLIDNRPRSLTELLATYDKEEDEDEKRSARRPSWEWVRKTMYGGMEPRRTRERSGWGGGYGK